MAEVLRPGAIPPTPKGVGRQNLAPATMARQVSQVATNFNEMANMASSTGQFSNAYNYGNLESGRGLNAAGQTVSDFAGTSSEYYRYYLDPASATRYVENPEWVSTRAGALQPRDSDWLASTEDVYGVAPTAPAVGEYDIPTSTTNFKRPRTLAAGYDPNEGTMTVVFRDGTFWNYYGVSAEQWSKFHLAYSKGPFLNRKSPDGKQAMDGDLVKLPNGPADLSSMTEEAQKFFVTVARAAQISFKENRPRYNKGYDTTGSQIKSYKNRQYRAQLKAKKQAAATAINSSLGKNPATGGKNRATANRSR